MIEVLIAAALTVLALGVLAASLLPAVRTRMAEAVPDPRSGQLHLAGDIVARSVRAARPALDAAAVRLLPDGGLEVRTGPNGAGALTFAIVEGALLVASAGPGHLGSRIPEGVLLDGLAPDGARFSLLDASGGILGDAPPSSAAAVLIELERGEHRVERLVRLRILRPLDDVA